MRILVSVIVPIYKVEQYLPQCIESIINQTYQDLEIILIDDGSPDACGIICDKYAQKDKRIIVIHKNNGGLSDARNYGIMLATGDYLGFVDSDDWIESDMFEVLVKLAVDNKADIVSSGVFYEYPSCTVVGSYINKKFSDTTDLMKALINNDINVGVWNKLYRKTLFTDITFPKGHVYEDTVTMHYIFLRATTVVCISKCFYHYRKKREDSIVQAKTMDNLIDYWRAHKSRYVYFLSDSHFNMDQKLIDKLLYNCAVAIARTWRWCYFNTQQDREAYSSSLEEIRNFTVRTFPYFGFKEWPLHLRFTIFMARFCNLFIYAMLYYLNQGYRIIKRSV